MHKTFARWMRKRSDPFCVKIPAQRQEEHRASVVSASCRRCLREAISLFVATVCIHLGQLESLERDTCNRLEPADATISELIDRGRRVLGMDD